MLIMGENWYSRAVNQFSPMISTAVVAALLVGCGVTDDPAPPTEATQPASPTTPDQTNEPTSAPTAEPSAPTCQDPRCYGQPRHAGTLDPGLVDQVSGMSASWRTPGALYAVSDVAGTSEVVAVTEDGNLIARIEIAGMAAENVEALAVGACGDARPDDTCLYVGDIGDHVGRPDVVIYRLPEPDMDNLPTAPIAADALRYTYPDGATNAEALLVDDAGRPLIVSKGSVDRSSGTTGSTRLYRGGTSGGALEYLGDIDLPEPESPVFALMVGNVVTGADTLGDGKVILRTYDEVLEFQADEPGADLATFPDWPVRRASSPSQVQSETIAYRVDDCGYLTTAEMGGDISAVDCVGQP